MFLMSFLMNMTFFKNVFNILLTINIPFVHLMVQGRLVSHLKSIFVQIEASLHVRID